MPDETSEVPDSGRWAPQGLPAGTLPNLLYLTQADGGLVAVDAATIYLMRPVHGDPRDTSGSLTRISVSIGPGLSLSIEVRESVEQIGTTLRAIAEGANISLAPAGENIHG